MKINPNLKLRLVTKLKVGFPRLVAVHEEMYINTLVIYNSIPLSSPMLSLLSFKFDCDPSERFVNLLIMANNVFGYNSCLVFLPNQIESAKLLEIVQPKYPNAHSISKRMPFKFHLPVC